MIWELSKMIIPIYMIITVMKHTFLLELFANIFAPLMQIFGLPGEATIVLILGNMLNLYAGIGAIASLHLTVKQITILAVMLSFSHSLIVETAICKKVGVNFSITLTIRIGLAILSGILMNLII